MKIYFITGNPGKLKEVQAIIPEIKGRKLDLPEIQEIDTYEIIKKKLKEATDKYKGRFLVEDTSLYLKCLNGFPGPLIKWMLKSIGNDGIYKLVNKYNNNQVSAKTIIGYNNNSNIKFFEGELKGTIVEPRGEKGFGWDSIFQPDGFNKTLAEMNTKEKNKISMRKVALLKFKEYLERNETKCKVRKGE